MAKKYIVPRLEARRVVRGFSIPTALNLSTASFARIGGSVHTVSWMLLLSHGSVSNMLHGPDSPTMVAVVVISFVFYFCGLVCEELKHIRL